MRAITIILLLCCQSVTMFGFMPIRTSRGTTLCRAQDEIPDFTVVGGDRSPLSDASKSVGLPHDRRTSSAIQKDDDETNNYDVWIPPPLRSKKRNSMVGTNWMEKNKNFLTIDDNGPKSDRFKDVRARQGSTNVPIRPKDESKTFRQDFRGTRVFVQNIPDHVTWQELKDHFRVAGDVVFASVSVDRETGIPKGHGIVQFDTTESAQKAIKIMRDHPIDDAQLYVRPDVQENDGAALRHVSPGGKSGPTPPTKWRCADEEALDNMEQEEYKAIRSLIKARDDARKRKNYDASDEMREELKHRHSVHLDDRLKMWWVSLDGKNVPNSITKFNGDGRWGGLKSWRQIPTTPENDACVDPDLVNGLLQQRDIARREKDFGTADALLEEARTSPDGDLYLRIHDESRTWRIWTDAPPPRSLMKTSQQGSRSDAPRRYETNSDHDEGSTKDQRNFRNNTSDECIALVKKYAPEKVADISKMLKQFPGREANILQKMKERYFEEE